MAGILHDTSRPSPAEVEQYHIWLKNLALAPGSKGLVLGATPELRDALFSAKVSVYSLDINLEMLLAMTELLEHANPDEVLVRASWLDSPLRDELFDVILGDAVFTNIPWDQRERFYDKIVRMLKPGGYFINRAFFVPDDKPFTGVQQVLDKYKHQQANYTTATELVFDLHLLTWDPNDHLGSMHKVKAALAPLRKADAFDTGSAELDKSLGIIWDNWLGSASDKVWVYPYRSEEEAEYERYFTVGASFEAPDHPHGSLTPMFLLKKK